MLSTVRLPSTCSSSDLHNNMAERVTSSWCPRRRRRRPSWFRSTGIQASFRMIRTSGLACAEDRGVSHLGGVELKVKEAKAPEQPKSAPPRIRPDRRDGSHTSCRIGSS